MSYICNHTGLGRIEQHPFGMVIEERSKYYQPYRFSFNGMEKDDEVAGSGNSLDFGARIFSTKICVWLCRDPLAVRYVPQSPYSFVSGNPISFIDPDGERLVIGEQHRNDVKRYFRALGLEKAFKVKRYGKVKLRKRWERKNSEILDHHSDLSEIYFGLKIVVQHKSKNVVVDIEQGDYDHMKIFPIYQNRPKEVPEYAELPDGKGGTVLKQVGTKIVMEKVLVERKRIGQNGITTSKTFYFGNYDPNNIDVKLHRIDMNEPLEGENGTVAQGSEAAAFVHEVLDHALEFMQHGKDLNTGEFGDREANAEDVTYENRARRVLNENERTGEDHEP